MFCILIPAVVAVWALSFPAVRILFERGAFHRETTEAISEILRWYLPVSLGLCLQAVLVRSFYACERMWVPTLLNTGIFAATIPAYILLGAPEVGLGIKSVPIIGATGAILQVISMIFMWAKKNGTDGMKEAIFNMARALVAFGIMIAAAVGLDHISGDFVRNASFVTLVVYACAAGIALFTLTLIVQRYLGSKDAKDILNELLGKVLRKLHLAHAPYSESEFAGGKISSGKGPISSMSSFFWWINFFGQRSVARDFITFKSVDHPFDETHSSAKHGTSCKAYPSSTQCNKFERKQANIHYIHCTEMTTTIRSHEPTGYCQCCSRIRTITNHGVRVLTRRTTNKTQHKQHANN